VEKLAPRVALPGALPLPSARRDVWSGLQGTQPLTGQQTPAQHPEGKGVHPARLLKPPGHVNCRASLRRDAARRGRVCGLAPAAARSPKKSSVTVPASSRVPGHARPPEQQQSRGRARTTLSGASGTHPALSRRARPAGAVTARRAAMTPVLPRGTAAPSRRAAAARHRELFKEPAH